MVRLDMGHPFKTLFVQPLKNNKLKPLYKNTVIIS
jgi:hypothetical protein